MMVAGILDEIEEKVFIREIFEKGLKWSKRRRGKLLDFGETNFP